MSDKTLSAPFSESNIAFERATSQLNRTERFAVSQAYPPKLILFAVGTMWALHFIWERLWSQAAISFLIFVIAGVMSARKIDKAFLSSTLLGRVFAELAQPSSVLTQALGFAALFFGAHVRGPFYVLIGASLVLLTHAVAWRRVLTIALRTGPRN